jgi:hypothetical protein
MNMARRSKTNQDQNALLKIIRDYVLLVTEFWKYILSTMLLSFTTLFNIVFYVRICYNFISNAYKNFYLVCDDFTIKQKLLPDRMELNLTKNLFIIVHLHLNLNNNFSTSYIVCLEILPKGNYYYLKRTNNSFITTDGYRKHHAQNVCLVYESSVST